MSEFTLRDFEGSLIQTDLSGSTIQEVLFAWGFSTEGYGSWEGWFVLKLCDGRYVYLTGSCDTCGWDCQYGDSASLVYADSMESLGLPEDRTEWVERPAELNEWVRERSLNRSTD